MKNTTPLKADKKVTQVATAQASGQTMSSAADSRPSTADASPSTAVAGPTTSDAGTSDCGIRDLAYEKWQAAGCPEGDGVQFWLEAEQDILASHKSD